MTATAPAVPNIANGLAEMARSRPHAMAIFAPGGRDRDHRPKHVHMTFQQLDRYSDLLAAGLAQVGVGKGVRTVLMVTPGLEFAALTFALFKAGAVPVLVDPGLGIKNLGPCLAEAEPGAFIGIPRAQVARKLFGWGKASIKTTITVGPRRPFGERSVDDLRIIGHGAPPAFEQPARDDETAAILFTSGSTGPPKGVVYTHAIFQAQVRMLRELYDIRAGEVDLCTFPLFALFAPILGMTSVVPEMDATRPGRANPTRIIEAINDFGATNLFGSPALIRRVGEFAEKYGITLPSLRRVISACAPVSPRILESFSKALDPSARIYTPYGATESLPVCSIGSDEILGETRQATDRGAGVCVGRAVDGMRVEIIGIQNEPIPEWSDSSIVPDGEVGEIVVKGPVVTRNYFRRPDADALAKIEDRQSGAVWHRMGDLGHRDPSGRIWFCGRKSHRVQTSTGTLFTIPVEGIFNAHPEVFRSALVGVPEESRTNPTAGSTPGRTKPILCVETRRRLSRREWESLKAELLALAKTNPISGPIETILRHPSFPVDIRHNAKIFREKLAVWAEARLR